MNRAALGIRPHTGRGVILALGGSLEEPSVLLRSEIQLADEMTFEGAAFYHTAEKMPLDEAAALIAAGTKTAQRRAREGIAKIVSDLRGEGYSVIGAGVPLAQRKLPADLAVILRAHTMIHMAEGELYRNALIEGSAACGLTVTTVKAKEIAEHCAAALGVTEAELASRIAALGKKAGRPWAEEHRGAAMLAWMALASAAGAAKPARVKAAAAKPAKAAKPRRARKS